MKALTFYAVFYLTMSFAAAVGAEEFLALGDVLPQLLVMFVKTGNAIGAKLFGRLLATE